jgi:hypothetical protein
MIMVNQPQVNPSAPGRSNHSLRSARTSASTVIEERVMNYPDPARFKITGQLRGTRMDGLSDLPQAVRPVI